MIPTVNDPTKLPDTEIQDPRIEVSVIDDPTANDPNVQRSFKATKILDEPYQRLYPKRHGPTRREK